MADEYTLDEFAEPDDAETIAMAPITGVGGDAAGASGPSGGFAGGTAEHAAKARGGNHRRLPLIITLCVIGVLLVAAVAGFFTARWYFSDKVAPGVTFGSVDVTGQTRDELTETVNDAISASTVTITDEDGESTTATLEDLGVTIDVDATVDDLLNAKSGDELFGLTRVNPFSTVEVGLNAEFDEYAMETYVTDVFVAEDERAVASTISYDSDERMFTVSEGRQGIAAQTDDVASAVEDAIANPGEARSVSVTYADVDMPISADAATQAADEANVRLSNSIVITNGDASEFTIPVDTIASWIVPSNNVEDGTITLTYDEDAIGSYLAEQMPAELDQEMVTQEDMVDSSGNVILTKVEGVNGVTVTSTDDAAEQVLQALTDGQAATIQATVEVTEYDTEQTEVTMRIVVDKSSQTATVYENDEVVRTFDVCTGKPTSFMETDSGTFYLYLKYSVQTMRGTNEDGSTYTTEGVKWVSYYNGGEGFHTASWNSYGIEHGDPANYGSHGCVNMYESDAKWIYDNCPEGTIVQVTGTTPTSAVR